MSFQISQGSMTKQCTGSDECCGSLVEFLEMWVQIDSDWFRFNNLNIQFSVRVWWRSSSLFDKTKNTYILDIFQTYHINTQPLPCQPNLQIVVHTWKIRWDLAWTLFSILLTTVPILDGSSFVCLTNKETEQVLVSCNISFCWYLLLRNTATDPLRIPTDWGHFFLRFCEVRQDRHGLLAAILYPHSPPSLLPCPNEWT